jgi:hypothetical protein
MQPYCDFDWMTELTVAVWRESARSGRFEDRA